MPIYTVRVDHVCAGGEHIDMRILRDNVEVKQVVIDRTDMLNYQYEFEHVLMAFLRQAIKAANATTLPQAKTAVEAAQWVL